METHRGLLVVFTGKTQWRPEIIVHIFFEHAKSIIEFEERYLGDTIFSRRLRCYELDKHLTQG